MQTTNKNNVSYVTYVFRMLCFDYPPLVSTPLDVPDAASFMEEPVENVGV